ncbi:MAG: hypothetical protein HYT21_01905 [Candidatus Nealsonbacteria bacterium]|nr:hypothetical protein [Candidatus Nealsonbacteria bacterium]
MARLRLMSSRGDKVVAWEPEKVGSGDPETEMAVREAERIFREETARGATVFATEPDQLSERVEKFDPSVEQTIVIVPRITGG